ncbi:hypothetical protein L207DRAFT_535531 [Hyaloscypha variabilis F]|uniref:SnoaL-like domain-containing protein n=1 Tax=Hyaloscypha variabilis (strain UAMH 11265 / GT02V1 / F) TaxID=1149755 RepID=A0A2J6R4S1_HYAVF|nr:hypothetical protein L207DRAFT_535531 [Hyaloscypha variabilis F]
MTLTNTIWPSHILAPPEVKQWLSDLYEIVDSKGDDSATKLAALFADNGTMHGMSGQAVGREASRKEAWRAITSRKHTVLRVYSASEDFSNILIIGNLVAGLNNGRQVDTEFIAQIDLEGVGEGKPRAKLYKVWGDSAPWVKAMS